MRKSILILCFTLVFTYVKKNEATPIEGGIPVIHLYHGDHNMHPLIQHLQKSAMIPHKISEVLTGNQRDPENDSGTVYLYAVHGPAPNQPGVSQDTTNVLQSNADQPSSTNVKPTELQSIKDDLNKENIDSLSKNQKESDAKQINDVTSDSQSNQDGDLQSKLDSVEQITNDILSKNQNDDGINKNNAESLSKNKNSPSYLHHLNETTRTLSDLLSKLEDFKQSIGEKLEPNVDSVKQHTTNIVSENQNDTGNLNSPIITTRKPSDVQSNQDGVDKNNTESPSIKNLPNNLDGLTLIPKNPSDLLSKLDDIKKSNNDELSKNQNGTESSNDLTSKPTKPTDLPPKLDSVEENTNDKLSKNQNDTGNLNSLIMTTRKPSDLQSNRDKNGTRNADSLVLRNAKLNDLPSKRNVAKRNVAEPKNRKGQQPNQVGVNRNNAKFNRMTKPMTILNGINGDGLKQWQRNSPLISVGQIYVFNR